MSLRATLMCPLILDHLALQPSDAFHGHTPQDEQGCRSGQPPRAHCTTAQDPDVAPARPLPCPLPPSMSPPWPASSQPSTPAQDTLPPQTESTYVPVSRALYRVPAGHEITSYVFLLTTIKAHSVPPLFPRLFCTPPPTDLPEFSRAHAGSAVSTLTATPWGA